MDRNSLERQYAPATGRWGTETQFSPYFSEFSPRRARCLRSLAVPGSTPPILRHASSLGGGCPLTMTSGPQQHRGVATAPARRRLLCPPLQLDAQAPVWPVESALAADLNPRCQRNFRSPHHRYCQHQHAAYFPLGSRFRAITRGRSSASGRRSAVSLVRSRAQGQLVPSNAAF